MGYRGSKSDITQSSSRLKKIIFFLMRSYFLKFFLFKKIRGNSSGKNYICKRAKSIRLLMHFSLEINAFKMYSNGFRKKLSSQNLF